MMFKRVLSVLLIIGLSACGGGGGGASTPSNTAPEAIATAPATTTIGSTINLDGSSSTDSDGTISTYSWTQVGSPAVTINNANQATASFVAPEVTSDTTLNFTLTVTDDDGATGTDTATIVVKANIAPTATASASPFAANAGSTVTLLGDGSDSDGTIAAWKWQQLSAASEPMVSIVNSEAKNASFTAPTVNTATTLDFKLTVTDDKGATGTDIVSVIINQADELASGSDDFDDGNYDGWTQVNDATNSNGTPAVGSWSAASGQLKQLADDISGDVWNQTDSYHRGTYLYKNPGLGTADFHFAVDATFTQQLVNEAHDIGVLFRYVDQNNYYRFTMNSMQGFSRLEKKVGGSFETLAVNSRGFSKIDQMQKILVVAKGTAIQVYVDGTPMFSATDNDFTTTGRSIGLYTQDKATFDNVVVHPAGDEPSIVLSNPVAYAVDTDNTIYVSAVAMNVPKGATVQFLVDGTLCGTDTTAPYSANCPDLTPGNHAVLAILKTPGDITLASHTNSNVASGGDEYIAIGDSLTEGVSDNYAADNVSASGRVIGFQGIFAALTDSMDSASGHKNVVFNEGIGGETSAGSVLKLSSILERHPNANKALLLLGTNDSNRGVTTTGFIANMQTVVNDLTDPNVGIEPKIALIPPAWRVSPNEAPWEDPGSKPRNATIRDYNLAIQNNFSDHVGPDLYSAFLTGNYGNLGSLISDTYVHFNSLGFAYVAALWHNSLYPSDTVSLPFILKNLNPSTTTPWLKQTYLEAGDYYYNWSTADSAATFPNARLGTPYANAKITSIPAALDGAVWIMTPQEQAANTSADYMSFLVDRTVAVYVAYDAGATSRPGWMSTFTDTGLQIGVTGDPSGTTALRLYRRTYAANATVTLGGNMATGAAGADSNYIVAVLPQ